MFVAIPLENFDFQNVIALLGIKNNMLENGTFNRLVYSDKYVILSHLYIDINALTFFITRNLHSFSKYKCVIDNSKCQTIINKMLSIEKLLLQLIQRVAFNKRPVYNLQEQLQQGTLKLLNLKDDTMTKHRLVLKIYGIWQTDIEYGLTFNVGYESPSKMIG